MCGGRQPDLFKIDRDLQFEDSRLHDLVRYWESKRQGRRLPSRLQIDPLEMRPFIGDIFMLDVIGAPQRFRYRLIGTNIVLKVGRDSTGKFQEDAYAPEHADQNNRHYRSICASRAPTRNFGVLHWVGRDYLKYEIANLPLAGDGDTVD